MRCGGSVGMLLVSIYNYLQFSKHLKRLYLSIVSVLVWRHFKSVYYGKKEKKNHFHNLDCPSVAVDESAISALLMPRPARYNKARTNQKERRRK